MRWLVDKLRTGYGRHAIGRMGVSDLVAINDWFGVWPHWRARRAEVQALFLKPQWCVEGEPGYVALQEALVEQLGIGRVFDGLTYSGPEPRK